MKGSTKLWLSVSLTLLFWGVFYTYPLILELPDFIKDFIIHSWNNPVRYTIVNTLILGFSVLLVDELDDMGNFKYLWALIALLNPFILIILLILGFWELLKFISDKADEHLTD